MMVSKIHKEIICGYCGERLLKSCAYPTHRTNVKPKPPLTERRKYCIGCWNKLCSITKSSREDVVKERTIWKITYNEGDRLEYALAGSEREAKKKAGELQTMPGITHVELGYEIMESVKV